MERFNMCVCACVCVCVCVFVCVCVCIYLSIYHPHPPIHTPTPTSTHIPIADIRLSQNAGANILHPIFSTINRGVDQIYDAIRRAGPRAEVAERTGPNYTPLSYAEEDTYMSYAEEDTCISYKVFILGLV